MLSSGGAGKEFVKESSQLTQGGTPIIPCQNKDIDLTSPFQVGRVDSMTSIEWPGL